MKTFGKLSCTLCMKERLKIMEALKLDKKMNSKNLINSNNEIYGACRHKPRFHRYALLQKASTDEGLTSPERSDRDRLLGSPFNDNFDTQTCVPCSPLVEKNNSVLVVDL